MANPHKGEVEFEAGGERYKLSYSFNALAEMEEAMDRPLDEIMAMLLPPAGERVKSPRLTDLRVMFWAGLLDHRPETTMDDAKRILSHMAPIEVGRLIGEAYARAMPQAETGGDESRPPMPDQKNGTGPALSTPISMQAAPKKGYGDRRRAM